MYALDALHDIAVAATPPQVATSDNGVQDGAIAALHYDSPHRIIASMNITLVES